MTNAPDNYDPTRAGAKRWWIAVAGVLLQLCLGTVYAWSYFQKPLMARYGWSDPQVAMTFSLAICFLGLAAAVGGVLLPAVGPRRLALTGAVCFTAGYLLAALALAISSRPLLYFGFGVVGGIGLGLGYVTPVATVAKWFPDRKGLVTGMVIMGFGLGALLMSKVLAPFVYVRLLGGHPAPTFALFGGIFLFITVPAALLLRNPSTAPQAGGFRAQLPSFDDLRQALVSRRFALMWLIFFANICAGIAIIGFQSPLLQDLLRRAGSPLDESGLAAAGATLIGISSLCNGLGRLLWGWLSDRLGRLPTFRIMLASELVVFGLLICTANPVWFTVLVCWILLCYGGGFGAMPSFVLDTFGARLMPAVYGCILTAWSLAGMAGPQLVAWFKLHRPADAARYSFATMAALVAGGLLLSLILRRPPPVRTS